MTDETALVRAVCEFIQEDTPRLMYADWLDEHGGPVERARAEFIRTQVALAELGPLNLGCVTACRPPSRADGAVDGSPGYHTLLVRKGVLASSLLRRIVMYRVEGGPSRFGRVVKLSGQYFAACPDALVPIEVVALEKYPLSPREAELFGRTQQLLHNRWTDWYTPLPALHNVCENIRHGLIDPQDVRHGFCRGFVSRIVAPKRVLSPKFRGSLLASFRTQPVESFVISDDGPTRWEWLPDMGDQPQTDYRWMKESHAAATGLSSGKVCDELFPSDVVCLSGDSVGEANDALSRMIVAWARTQVGLSVLP